MKRLIDLPLDRPVAVLMLLLCLTVLGVVSVISGVARGIRA